MQLSFPAIIQHIFLTQLLQWFALRVLILCFAISADKKKTKEDGDEVSAEQEKNDKEAEDYMDKEMVEMDERSRQRIEIIFREFKSELEQYGAAAGPEKPPKGKSSETLLYVCVLISSNTFAAEKDPAAKQGLQDKLHLLKLSSLDPTPNDVS